MRNTQKTNNNRGTAPGSRNFTIMGKKKKEVAAVAEKKVADLQIIDVLKSPEFYANVTLETRRIWKSREDARKNLKLGERLKAHPIDRIHEGGMLEPGEFIVEYANILNKEKNGLPRAMRDVIETLGNTAFNKTMQKLIEDEKARNNSNGNDK